MKFKILLLFYLLQHNIFCNNIIWNESDEESLFRQSDVL